MLTLAEDIYGKNEPKDDAETNVITIVLDLFWVVFGSFSQILFLQDKDIRKFNESRLSQNKIFKFWKFLEFFLERFKPINKLFKTTTTFLVTSNKQKVITEAIISFIT